MKYVDSQRKVNLKRVEGRERINTSTMYRYMLLCLLMVSVAYGQVYGGGLGPVVPNCPMNEYWSACGRNCDETCTIQYPLCRYIMFFPTCRREPGCTCASNYVRNSYSGACVPRSTC
ncbi:venom serine protease inhibitor-like isoform X2 [Andrena cerasifolii]|uniref:venom serine protease inhibitor-like isoform X2 n=1 Tax=Andrena cerasifolii TaxID=2819439 RepID=UPI004037AEDE